MEVQWYYVHNGQQRGPISAAELARVIQSREAGPDPLVWRAGLPEWIPFSKLDPQSLAVELQFPSPSSQPMQVGTPVGSGRVPAAPGGVLTYLTPAGELANLSSKDARTSMVLGIISVSLLPFYCCSIFGLVAMIGSLVCGILAVKFARKGGETIRTGNAVAGKVCGIIGIVSAAIYIIVLTIIIVVVVLDARRSFPTPRAAPTTGPVFIPTPAQPTTVPSN